MASYISHNVDDPSDKIYPMTEDCKGIIMYNPDGYMSAQLQIPGQTPFANNNEGPRQAPGAAEGFFAYTGRFYLNEDGREPILMHEMQVCSYPDWLGNTQRRLMKFTEEDGRKYLTLGPESASKVGDTNRLSELKWARLKENHASSPT